MRATLPNHRLEGKGWPGCAPWLDATLSPSCARSPSSCERRALSIVCEVGGQFEGVVPASYETWRRARGESLDAFHAGSAQVDVEAIRILSWLLAETAATRARCTTKLSTPGRPRRLPGCCRSALR